MIPRRTLTVRRYAAGTYSTITGKWVEGGTNDFTISASVQPLRGKEVELLPEARRESQSYKLYTDIQLLTVDTSNSKNPDRVQINGTWHEVLIVEDWQNDLINHYKIVVVKL